ncbi:hypothetical protein Forpe1208_v016660 [Fusarium oxysporum f. sp. rapae]|uniref:Uncharacterized protein n=1 Tax=Fusarium oxysporum f. sp. rapae TaxID=485398 RepID=A0A8J5NG17_FUSOX|nr:hypothetical protein Forpe1208_v016660 [Fusarium oxysporum f. sp. rapae]
MGQSGWSERRLSFNLAGFGFVPKPAPGTSNSNNTALQAAADHRHRFPAGSGFRPHLLMSTTLAAFHSPRPPMCLHAAETQQATSICFVASLFRNNQRNFLSQVRHRSIETTPSICGRPERKEMFDSVTATTRKQHTAATPESQQAQLMSRVQHPRTTPTTALPSRPNAAVVGHHERCED